MPQKAFENDLAAVHTPDQFAGCLQRLRRHLGLSLRDVQRQGNLIGPGLSRTSLSEFEAGTRLPTKTTLESLLRVCGITDPDDIEQWWAAKVILIKPSDAAGTSTSIAMSAFRADKSPQALERNLRHNLDLLDPLTTKEGFELRVVDYLGPYTLYAYDPDSPHGKMDLRLSSFRGKHELRPTFRVEHEHDPDWFDYFYDQFVQIWNAGERVTPKLVDGARAHTEHTPR